MRASTPPDGELASPAKHARPLYLLAVAGCLLALTPLAYLPLGFIGFVFDPRASFGSDSGAFRDYEIEGGWLRLIGSLLAPGLVCVLAGIALAGRSIARRWKVLGAALIISAIALASWKLSADINTLHDTISTNWKPGI